MYSINKAIIDCFEEYKKLAESKKDDNAKKILLKLGDFIEGRYSFYEDSSIAEVQPSTDLLMQNKEVLRGCYRRDNATIKSIIGKITLAQVGSGLPEYFCPYCGMQKCEKNECDHYLPKVDFPEFSVYAHNLIPSCSGCNGDKKEIWHSSGEQQVIYCYEYTPLNVQVIFAQVEFHEGIPVFDFYIKGDVELVQREELELIKRHVRNLKVFKRYCKGAEEVVESFIDDAKVQNIPFSKAKNWLENKCGIYSKRYGPNYWKIPIYQTIVSSEDQFNQFLNWKSNI